MDYEEMKKFRSLGIEKECNFELKELCGTFVVDLEHRVICDISRGCNCIVNGLYENLLKGKYQVKG